MRECDIFIEALQQSDPSRRAALLDDACQGDATLRGQVERLLAEHERQESFILDTPPAGLNATVHHPISERPGTVIGPYKLLQQIGEGGMGVVFMAEQTEPIQRTVALKIIKPGMDTRQVIARFEAERQALAMMDHPHIAKVLDAGTTDSGRPYFVMELVKGVPITQYCDEKHLPLRARLELLVPVCQAVQHAHHKGLIHRDIKPSNVLVAEYDDQAMPKVIDFGVAKATAQKLTDRTMFTEFGQVVGTVEYMSPEQAKLNQLDIDTRSDIYSLGVLLYELLTGSTPFGRKRLQEAAFDEMLRIIREEEPPKPSTRLSTAEGLPSIAANRGSEPLKLNRLVRGELDWVVMKALEKDRNRRYETVSALAADVQRYLHDEAVQACPPSAGYRLWKFARRNKAPVLVALAILFVLMVGIAGTSWGLVRAIAEAKETESARQTAEENFQRTREAVDDYFTLVSQSTLFDVPGLQPLRKDLLEKAVSYYREMAEKRGDDPSILAGLAVAHLRLAQVYHEVDRNDDAIAALGEALDVAERLRREHPNASEHRRRLAGFWKGKRLLRPTTDIPSDALAARHVLTRWVNLWREFVQEFPDERAFQSDLASAFNILGDLEGGSQRWGESIDCFQQAIAILETLHRDYPKERIYREALSISYEHLAFSTHRSGRHLPGAWHERRRTLYEELVADFPKTPLYQEKLASILKGYGMQLTADGRLDEAEATHVRAIEVMHGLVAQFPEIANYRLQLNDCYVELHTSRLRANRSVQSTESIRQAITVLDSAMAGLPAQRQLFLSKQAHNYRFLGFQLRRAGDFPGARDAFNASTPLFRECSEKATLNEKATCLQGQAANFFEVSKLWGVQTHDSREAALKALAFGELIETEDLARHITPDWVADHYVQLGQLVEQVGMPGDAVRIAARLRPPVVTLNTEGLQGLVNLHFQLGLLLREHGLMPEASRQFAAMGRVAAEWELSLQGNVSASDANQMAWRLSVFPFPPGTARQDAVLAVKLATKAVELLPDDGAFRTTLGAAYYRAGQWQKAIEAFEESMAIRNRGGSVEWLFLAMAYSQLGDQDEAREWYDQAVEWMDKNSPNDGELIGIRNETETLLATKTEDAVQEPENTEAPD